MRPSHDKQIQKRNSQRRWHAVMYRSVLSADISPDGMMVSTDGIVVYANPVAAKIWEARDAQEVIGTKAVDLVHPDFLGLSENRHAETQVGNSNLLVAQFKIITFRGNEKFCGIHGRRNYY